MPHRSRLGLPFFTPSMEIKSAAPRQGALPQSISGRRRRFLEKRAPFGEAAGKARQRLKRAQSRAPQRTPPGRTIAFTAKTIPSEFPGWTAAFWIYRRSLLPTKSRGWRSSCGKGRRVLRKNTKVKPFFLPRHILSPFIMPVFFCRKGLCMLFSAAAEKRLGISAQMKRGSDEGIALHRGRGFVF